MNVYMILITIAVLILYEALRSVFIRTRERRNLIRIAEKHKLSDEEKGLVLSLASGKDKVNSNFIFSSLIDFHRFFGPLMQDLAGKAEKDREAGRKLSRIFFLRNKLFGEVYHHFGTITSTIQIRNGRKVTLDFSWEGRKFSVSSVVMDVDEKAVTLANFSHDGEFIRFPKGHPFTVMFFREKDGYYRFESHALRDIDQRSPGFLLLSHTEEIQRVQSRQFYRLETSIPFKFKRFSWDKNLEKRYLPASEELTGDIDGVIGNISAGGLMFSTGEKLTRRDMLLFDLQINSEISIQDLSGKVVGFTEGDTEKENGLNRVHLNFLNIKSGEQDLILHMIQQHRLREEA